MAPVDETATTEVVEDDTAGGIRLCSITIPEGKKPGDVFLYKDEDDGLELEVTVPEDGKPGDTMEILLDEDDDEIEAISVALGPHVSDITINMVTLLENDDDGEVEVLDEGEETPTATVSEMIAAEEAAIDDEEGDGTNFMVWPTAIELAQFLASPNATSLLTNRKNALELGSGVGCSGMALTAALSKIGTPSKVTLTDLPEALPLLTANVDENKENIEGNGVTCETKELKWGTSSDEKYDLVIAADVLYNADPEVLNDLASTMTSALSDDGIIILANRWRVFDDERVFFTKMSEMGIEFTHVKDFIKSAGGSVESSKVEGSYTGLDTMCNLSWQNFGNKDSAESNDFFANTKFKSKDGEEKCLNDIDEADLAIMEDTDFDNCELSFIQFFVGKRA